MPNKCCVYGCNSNYASTTERCSRSTFKFPRDDDLRAKWKDLKLHNTVMFVLNKLLRILSTDIALLKFESKQFNYFYFYNYNYYNVCNVLLL